MIRWLILVAVVIVLSTVATVAMQWAPSAYSDTTVVAPVVPKKPDGPAPLVEVEQSTTHHFGMMAQLTIGTHVFKIRNTGKTDLTLANAGTTCKCTIANLGRDGTATVKPGEGIDIRLEWNTKEVNGHFEQKATIKTNDPLHEKVELVIEGQVQPPILMFPPDPVVQLSNLPNEQGSTTTKVFISPDRPNFKITGVTSSRPELLEASIAAIDASQAAQYRVTAGQQVIIQVKRSRSVGPFSEELLIKTDHPQRPELRINVIGRLMGPINTAPDEVRLPNVLGARGATALVSLFVRGQAETKFTVEKAPAPLKVSVDPVDDHSSAGDAPRKSRQYRVTVTVPRGTPSQDIEGTIELKTDHPEAGHVTIPVRILVTEG